METFTSLIFLAVAVIASFFFGVIGFLIVLAISAFVQYGARKQKREYELMKMFLQNQKNK